jgi:hypothetical protein
VLVGVRDAEANPAQPARGEHLHRVLVQQASQPLAAPLGHEIEEVHVAHARLVGKPHFRLADDAIAMPQVGIALRHLRHALAELLEVEPAVGAHFRLDPVVGAEAFEERIAPERDARGRIPGEIDGGNAQPLRVAIAPHDAFGLLALLDPHHLPAAEARLLQRADRLLVALARPGDARLHRGIGEHHLVQESIDHAPGQAPAQVRVLADEEVDARGSSTRAGHGRIVVERRHVVGLDVARVMPVDAEHERANHVVRPGCEGRTSRPSP